MKNLISGVFAIIVSPLVLVGFILGLLSIVIRAGCRLAESFIDTMAEWAGEE